MRLTLTGRSLRYRKVEKLPGSTVSVSSQVLYTGSEGHSIEGRDFQEEEDGAERSTAVSSRPAGQISCGTGGSRASCGCGGSGPEGGGAAAGQAGVVW